MTALRFIPWSSTALMLPEGTVPGKDACVGFVATSGTVPASLTLAEALAAQGCFVFLLGLPADGGRLAMLAATLSAFLGGSGRALVKTAFFTTAGPFGLQATTIEMAPSGGGWATTALTMFRMGNLTLRVAGNAPVTVSADGASLVFGAAPHSLSMFAGTQAANVLFTSTVTLNVLGPAGFAGTFSGSHPLDAKAIEAFDVGLKYVLPAASGKGPTGQIPIRLFDLTAAGAPPALGMVATLDPIQPENPARTFWNFAATAAVPSHFANAVGLPLALVPGDGSDGGPAARLVLTRHPILTPPVDRMPLNYYLAPVGDFLLSAPAGTSGQMAATLMPGLSGSEYFALDATRTALRFVAGFNSYVVPGADGVFTGLAGDCTTSWATVVSAGAPVQYFAQPRQAAQHQPPATAPAAGDAAFLSFLPLLAGAVPTVGSPPVPVTPYRGIVAGPAITADQIHAVEAQVLATTRRRGIPAPTGNAGLPVGATDVQGATAQGFLLDIEGGGWKSLALAHTDDPTFPSLSLATVAGDLQQAFLTDPLMVVISDPAALQSCASYEYQLTAAAANGLAETQAIPQAVVDKVDNGLYATRTDFAAMLKGALRPAEVTQYQDLLCASAARFTLSIAGWQFDLSAESWSLHGTVLLFKFVSQPLSRLVQSTSGWFRQGASFNANAEATRQQLEAFISQARASDNPDLQDFVTTIADDPNWTGMLAINVSVPLTELPPQMEGLAAGLDVTKFYAHHVGVRVTPLAPDGPGAVSQRRSETFGLIHYQDEQPLTGADTYDFKVLSLRVAFANSDIAGFSSQVTLYVATLFGDTVQALTGTMPTALNNLVFDGTYQRSATPGAPPGSGTYTFATAAPTIYDVNGAVLDKIEIARAQFVTLTPSAQQVALNKVSTQFRLEGSMSFRKQPVDVFGYGSDADEAIPAQVDGLVFTGLAVDMSFESVTPTYKTFGFDVANVQPNATASKVRADSLQAHFPVKLAGLSGGTSAATPANSHFMPVDLAMSSSGLGSPWFALTYQLNLGSLGNLAAVAGFTASFVLAWSPGGMPYGADLPIYVGLGLPGVQNGERAITLESIIKLNFGDIGLLNQGSTYILEIRQIALKILALTFPRVGQTSLYIFGDPAGDGGNGVGWYGGYAEPDINNPAAAPRRLTQ